MRSVNTVQSDFSGYPTRDGLTCTRHTGVRGYTVRDDGGPAPPPTA